MKDIKNAVSRAIKNIRSALMGEVISVKKNGSIFAKISDDEEIRDIDIISPHGLYSLPDKGSYGQLIFNNSSKSASFIGVEHDNLPINIDVGEVILYNPNGGNYIHLKNNGDIELKGNKITANGEDLTVDKID